jgi:hypothetical protein
MTYQGILAETIAFRGHNSDLGELSAESARALVEKILAALATSEIEHSKAAHHAEPHAGAAE